MDNDMHMHDMDKEKDVHVHIGMAVHVGVHNGGVTSTRVAAVPCVEFHFVVMAKYERFNAMVNPPW